MTEEMHAAHARETPAVGAVERAGWRGVLREFATIVAGVLVALAGQAWWSDRENSARERDYLHQLYVDTRANEAALRTAIALDSSVGAVLFALARALYTPRSAVRLDSLRTLIHGPVFASSNFDARTGTYTALLSSGDIRLLRTDSLRAMVVAYAASLDYEHDMLRLFYEQAYLDPGRLARALPFARRLLLGLPDSVTRDVDAAELSVLYARRADPELAGIVFSLQVANANRIQHLRVLLYRTREVLAVLAAEPALRGDVAAARGELSQADRR
jgi:hypothetical protein